MEENSDKNILLSKEFFWIKLFMGPFSFGLNDNIKGYGKVRDINNPLAYKTNHPFYSLSMVKRRENRGKKKNRNEARMKQLMNL